MDIKQWSGQGFRKLLVPINIAAENNAKNTMCGGIRADGTFSGNAIRVGRSTVHVGINKRRFDLLGFKSICKSLLFIRIIVAAIKAVHSMQMFAGL